MPPRAGRALCLALLLAAGAAPVRGDSACAPWPGDFSPLPDVADPDPLRARWARLRADETVERASALEREDRIEANRMWQRALCLDPQSAAARAGVERTRPQVIVTRASEIASDLRAPDAAPRLGDIEASLERAERLMRAARFGDARSELRRVRLRLDAVEDASAPRTARVRLEVLEATSFVAFGDEAAARSSFERALRVDPALELDPRSTPRKVRRVFDAVREATP